MLSGLSSHLISSIICGFMKDFCRALVAMDRSASFGMGRQCTIHDEE